jgi:integrase
VVEIEAILTTNPVVKMKRPSLRSVRPGQSWTTAELRKFLGVPGHCLGAYQWLAAYTGARRGELLHQRWPDIDLDTAEITVTGSTNVIEVGAVKWNPRAPISRGQRRRRT